MFMEVKIQAQLVIKEEALLCHQPLLLGLLLLLVSHRCLFREQAEVVLGRILLIH
jgi:hypothetical protein